MGSGYILLLLCPYHGFWLYTSITMAPRNIFLLQLLFLGTIEGGNLKCLVFCSFQGTIGGIMTR